MNQYDGNYSDRSILTFVFLYSISRFFRLYDALIKEKVRFIQRHPWGIYFASVIVFFVAVSFSPPLISRGINYFARAYNTIGLTLFSILFFYCFKRLSIQKRWINIIAKSTFAIYLIHGNNIVTYHRWIYNPFTSFGITIDSIHLRLIYLFFVAIFICTGCVVIDQIRQLLFKYLGIDWSIKKLDACVCKRFLNNEKSREYGSKQV